MTSIHDNDHHSRGAAPAADVSLASIPRPRQGEDSVRCNHAPGAVSPHGAEALAKLRHQKLTSDEKIAAMRWWGADQAFDHTRPSTTSRRTSVCYVCGGDVSRLPLVSSESERQS